MKFPKNRANLYYVERWSYENSSTVVVGAFAEPDDAYNYKEACEQEFIDKGFGEEISKQEIKFNVGMTTFYG